MFEKEWSKQEEKGKDGKKIVEMIVLVNDRKEWKAQIKEINFHFDIQQNTRKEKEVEAFFAEEIEEF